MPWIIPLILIGFPVVELAIFVAMINGIGFLATIGLAIGGAMLGVIILRNQSLTTTWAMREQLARGEFPADSVFDSLCLTFAGLLFIFPGFISDGLAILLLIPPLRHILRLWWGRKTPLHATTTQNTREPYQDHQKSPPSIIEGDYQVLESNDKEQ